MDTPCWWTGTRSETDNNRQVLFTVPDNLIIHFRLTTGMLLRILKIKPPDGTAGGGGDCGVHNFCSTCPVLDDKEQLVDLHRRSQLPAVVLEDKIMLYVITFISWRCNAWRHIRGIHPVHDDSGRAGR